SLLLTVTDNDPDALTEDSTEFVLKHALAEHGRELELQLAEREREVQEGARRISEAEARELAREVTFKREADRVARRVVRTGFVAISVLCVAAAFFSFPWPVNPPFIQLLPTWAAVVLGIIALAAFIVGLAGWSFRHARRWLEMPLSRSLERRYRARFNPADDAS
ncbi:MAG TPA: hypothetical protein GYA10_01495, partial [Alphaproteobacteria bacterium]|nr:hypothetical protein [Alphaproteobacteria bacterium]